MSEYAVLLADQVAEFLDVADEKTERICKEKLGYLADHPYPGAGRGNKEKLPYRRSPGQVPTPHLSYLNCLLYDSSGRA